MLLARLNSAQERYSVAESQFEESIAIARNHNDVETMSDCLLGLAYLALAQKQYVRAVRILGADEKVRETARVSIYPVERPTYDRSIVDVRTFLGGKAFTALLAEGRAMSLSEALVASNVTARDHLATETPTIQIPAYPIGLTARKVEVLRLVAQETARAFINSAFLEGMFHVASTTEILSSHHR